MKTPLLALFLLFTGSAWAEWVFIGSTTKADVFIDPATIRKDANLRKVWQVYDLKQRDKGVLSDRGRAEYDCSQERYRWLYSSTHGGAMASGELLSSDANIGAWRDIPPDSIANEVLQIVCGK
jgi:hypothetical protein